MRRLDEVRAMCERRRASLVKLFEKPVRPVHPVAPAVNAAAAATAIDRKRRYFSRRSGSEANLTDRSRVSDRGAAHGGLRLCCNTRKLKKYFSYSSLQTAMCQLVVSVLRNGCAPLFVACSTADHSRQCAHSNYLSLPLYTMEEWVSPLQVTFI